MTKDQKITVGLGALCLVTTYWAVSMLVFNLRDPSLTRMEVLLRTWDAVTWSDPFDR